MGSSSTVIADSVYGETDNPHRRLITLELYYPHIIHNQVLTHRMITTNTVMSSRAEPVESMIRRVQDDPYIPSSWPVNCAGQSPRESITDPALISELESSWRQSIYDQCEVAKYFASQGVHKEITNRLLETFSYKKVLATATLHEWLQFIHKRKWHYPQELISNLAGLVADSILNSIPRILTKNDWHLPYVDADDREIAEQTISSYIRCYQVGKYNVEGKMYTFDEERIKYGHLVSGSRKHLKPAEHIRTPVESGGDIYDGWQSLRYGLEIINA